MKLIFKPGSDVSKKVIEMYNQKEAMHQKAVAIIEEVTGCKIRVNSELGSRYAMDFRYLWSFTTCYFEDDVTTVPGYISEKDNDGKIHFRINKRTKIYRLLNERFSSEIKPIRSRDLNQFGIKTQGGRISYGWELCKEGNGEIAMYINPEIYNLIDFSKCTHGTICDITVKQ